MDWFKSKKKGIEPQEQKDLPNGLWLKCESCGEIVHKKQLERNYFICSKCNFHFRIESMNYIKMLLDDDSFEEFNTNLRNADPLKFKDTKKYTDRIKAAVKATGQNSAIRTGLGKIKAIPVVFCVMDFSFIGGSMGTVVGEKVSRAIDVAIEKHLPLIIISASGGARMMEGALSLMQMAKTSAKLACLANAGLPFISICTHPTTGGVSASYAMLGDLILAEPGALIGFAGPRVIKQTIGQDLPKGFQRSEFLLKHGFIDAIYPRSELKDRLAEILTFFEEPSHDQVQEN
ncbi:acetyl-CoA carboxylase carboxyltransferase subunit beta [candidate division KSB1 bacterium]|nr:acetyl-CoA carboxylase carboxyltransferase subunit beta [candidate division KSB1 bacterium]